MSFRHWRLVTMVCLMLALAAFSVSCRRDGGTTGTTGGTTGGATGAATGGTTGKGDPKTIKIVSSLPLTGSSRVQSETVVNAIRMAIEEVGGKVGDFKITYDSWDDATAQSGNWDKGKEQENAEKAVSDPDVMAYIGTFNSGAAKISIPILNEQGLLMVSPANTWPGLTKKGDWEKGEPDIYYPKGTRNYMRVVPADDIQGAAAAAWAKKLGVKKVYVLNDKEVYGKGIATIFVRECKKRGIEVVGEEGIDGQAPDYRALMSKIKSTTPDLVYFGGTTQNGAGKLVKDMKEVGVEAKFMGPDGIMETAFIAAAGPAAEGVYVTIGAPPVEKMSEAARKWYETYKAKYKNEPEAYAIYGYEAAKVVLHAIKKAGKKDREAIRAAAFSIKDFDEGVLGKWSVDANGDTSLTNTMCGWIVKNGKFEFVELLSTE